MRNLAQSDKLMKRLDFWMPRLKDEFIGWFRICRPHWIQDEILKKSIKELRAIYIKERLKDR